MATSDILNSMKTHIQNAYDVIEAAGGTVPSEKNLENLSGSISEVTNITSGYGTLYTTQYPQGIDLGIADIPLLGNTFSGANATFNLSVGKIYKNDITGFAFGEKKPLFLPESFLANCPNFNSPLIVPNNITKIPYGFLYGCTAFNSQITFLGEVTSIEASFLYGCKAYNKPLPDLSKATIIGDSFLASASAFNQPVTLSSSLQGIGRSFLSSCTSFNQNLTLPNTLESIGNNFMQGCTEFNKPMTVPPNVQSIGTDFLYNCTNFTGLLTVNTSTSPTDIRGLSTNSSTAPMYVTGVTLTGPGASAWQTALPNRTASPYRKLILGTSIRSAKDVVSRTESVSSIYDWRNDPELVLDEPEVE